MLGGPEVLLAPKKKSSATAPPHYVIRGFAKSANALKTRKIAFWCDCGPHFRSKRFFYGIFCEVPEMEFSEDFVEIVLNFFLEKHGKAVVHRPHR